MEKEEEVTIEEKIKSSLLSHMEISLMLDGYDDIFSDFDPRPYSQRALSDDFLIEAKKAAKDKDDTLELRFIIPKKERNLASEVLIKKRLRDHFKRHADMLDKEIKKIKGRGMLMAVFGILVIFFAAYLHSFKSSAFIIDFLIVLLEPAGWFTAWTGLDEIYYTTRTKKPDYEFYSKMSRAEIQFIPY